MRFPFFGRSEDRAAGGFTDLWVNQLIAQAGGNVYADVGNSAAAELCAGLWGRAFASASLSPAFPGIGPGTLGAIARAMILDGEYLGAIDVSDGALRLLQSYSWDVVGGANPRTWRYSLQLPGPSGDETRQLPPEGVVSCRWATSPATPWRGVGPFQSSSLTVVHCSPISKRRWQRRRARQVGMSCRRQRTEWTRRRFKPA